MPGFQSDRFSSISRGCIDCWIVTAHQPGAVTMMRWPQVRWRPPPDPSLSSNEKRIPQNGHFTWCGAYSITTAGCSSLAGHAVSLLSQASRPRASYSAISCEAKRDALFAQSRQTGLAALLEFSNSAYPWVPSGRRKNSARKRLSVLTISSIFVIDDAA